MHRIHTPAGRIVSYEKDGSGPPLVLIHGAFSDHRTNWEFVKPIWEREFTMYAMARPGRGETPAAPARALEDDSRDAVALIESIGEPVFLLGHSFGAHVALAAAAMAPELVSRLVLYEPPWTSLFSADVMAPLEALAAAGDWDAFSFSFFRDILDVPVAELDALRATGLWPPIVADAPASLADLRALRRFRFHPDAFIDLPMPVLLQTGTESPQHFYATDGLHAALLDARIGRLPGQAHEGMTTAPPQYAEAVRAFLKGPGHLRPASNDPLPPLRTLAF
jgi:pimeloyl-ACP methyl ester carboxylesterase